MAKKSRNQTAITEVIPTPYDIGTIVRYGAGYMIIMGYRWWNIEQQFGYTVAYCDANGEANGDEDYIWNEGRGWPIHGYVGEGDGIIVGNNSDEAQSKAS